MIVTVSRYIVMIEGVAVTVLWWLKVLRGEGTAVGHTIVMVSQGIVDSLTITIPYNALTHHYSTSTHHCKPLTHPH